MRGGRGSRVVLFRYVMEYFAFGWFFVIFEILMFLSFGRKFRGDFRIKLVCDVIGLLVFFCFF